MAVDPTRASKWDPVYQGPYKVVDKNKGGAYTLENELGEEIAPRRTIEMLKPIQQNSKSLDKHMDTKTNYEVEKIVDHEKTKDGFIYLVKWKGYSVKDNSWVDDKDFNNEGPIKKYWAAIKKANTKLGKRLTKDLEGGYVKPSKYDFRPRRHVKAFSRNVTFSDQQTYERGLIHTPLDRAQKMDLEHVWKIGWKSQNRRGDYGERKSQDVTSVKLYPEWMVSRNLSSNSSGLGRWR